MEIGCCGRAADLHFAFAVAVDWQVEHLQIILQSHGFALLRLEPLLGSIGAVAAAALESQKDQCDIHLDICIYILIYLR